MLMTQRRGLRVAAGTLETANLLFLKLLIKNRSAARVYPGLAYRTYMPLVGKTHWRCQSIFDFLPELDKARPRITLEHVPGGGVKTPVDELAYMALVTAALQPANVFEIGTFRGRTALNFALNSPADAQVQTLDLPEDAADTTLGVADRMLVKERVVGVDYHGTDVQDKITQLWGSSLDFDFTPYHGRMDLVFVDGGHTYELARNDTEQALRMCRPGGVIMWHDFANYGDYHDVTRAVLDVLPGDQVVQLESSQLAAYRVPS